ncbi:MAG: S49 family peptidase, partial [Bryobacteraceae bacterium]
MLKVGVPVSTAYEEIPDRPSSRHGPRRVDRSRYSFFLHTSWRQAAFGPDGATLIVPLNGDVPEKAPVSLPIPFIGSPTPLTVKDFWHTLNAASRDNRIKAVIVVLDNVDAGWAKLQEIRENLLTFKKSGKPMVAYLRSPGTREYYLATAADKIYMSPEDLLDLKGMRVEASFYKQSLQKIGVEVEVQHVGRYKDAGDMFTETSLTPESREVIDSLLDNLYGHLVDTIAKGRKRTREEILSTI